MTASVMIMAGGTGGHIFPALAVAEALRSQGWQVRWLGGPAPSMESRIVPGHGFELVTLEFSGVRGKGLGTWLRLPWRMIKALWASLGVIRRYRPDVVVGFGGYISFSTGLMAGLTGCPLVLHEQNAIAGSANRWLSRWASRRLCAFPKALPNSEWVGNPLREDFLNVAEPRQRYANRTGPLRILVVGGSLGAKALNERVPAALSLLPESARPVVVHQSGEKHLPDLIAHYQEHGVNGDLRAFIDDMATELAQADVVIARAGASTVTEVAAVGVAAIFVPFPQAVDDHQTANARFLSQEDAAMLVPQRELSAERLAELILSLDRASLMEMACKARDKGQRQATAHVVRACEELVS
ncbi:MAG: undecaprenyldiphospho-muramoylpentapeptide beta-N-acetylglucosaminyltransferase [Betaproteobacteria bacterium]|jgi:UDP-N-acetylglucosamine--N-acetylmuramyl-(pentapeptide) pyrophosphoryl-undecaprenol N-acetylglucosamine transferase|nr:undecaprenyldiphospho-muramoylpentapeptide beta-N-acetylglucosaminyltransferase [Betaproteobacteria bacterium]